ncbi:MAG: hypothetical protein IIA87_00240 [Nanoarchaeota archaeon]|nr:hypothetical protein [Nanoarchaeota archaeon]
MGEDNVISKSIERLSRGGGDSLDRLIILQGALELIEQGTYYGEGSNGARYDLRKVYLYMGRKFVSESPNDPLLLATYNKFMEECKSIGISIEDEN